MKNSEKQALFRKNMKKKGYIQTTVFIPEESRKELKEFVSYLKESHERSK